MLRVIKQVFIVLFSFRSSLSTTCLSLNDETCMARATVIDLNPAERKYLFMISLDKSAEHKYLFMTSLDKCNGRYNVLSPKNMCSKGNKRHKCGSI